MNKKAYFLAIKLITKRDYSRFKLSEKLKSKDFSDNEIDEVISELVEKNFLREDYYLENRVKSLLRKNYGPCYIIQKLQQEHLECSQEYIQEVYLELGLSQKEQIISITQKKLRLLSSNLSTFDKKKKILTLVQNKGHQLSNAQLIVEGLC